MCVQAEEGMRDLGRSGGIGDVYKRQAGIDEVLRTGEEVGERVGLVGETTGFVPTPAQLGATAHVRDGEDHPSVQQRQASDREGRVARNAIGAVTVEQTGRGAVGLDVSAPDQALSLIHI